MRLSSTERRTVDLLSVTVRRAYLFLAAAALAAIAVVATASDARLWFIYDVVYVAEVAVAWYAALRPSSGQGRRPWILLAVAQSLWVVGDLVSDTQSFILHIKSQGGVYDVAWVSAYPVLLVALVLMVRRRAPGQLRAAVLDALTLTTAVALTC